MVTEFYYTGLENIKSHKNERGTYCTFAMFHRETGVKISEIITNASLCGSWHWTQKGELLQDAGIHRYSLPSTPAGIRKALRTKALDKAALCIDIGVNQFDESQGYTNEFAKMIYEKLK